jgi:iron(III) transport system ATP-binding protein
MAFLIVKNLKKTYGENLVLKGVSISVAEGEFLSLLGPSGCGKTTLLRCIAGLEVPDPDSDEIAVNTEILSRSRQFVRPEKRNFGMVFQNYAVWPHMTVAENVAFPLRIQVRQKKITRSQLETRLSETLALVHLDSLRHRYPHELSGGQQQRVALARALSMNPRVLLLDEPLSNLDAILRDELGGEIKRVQRELRLTTILVTHDRKEALSLSDRIILMNQGRVDSEGSPEVLYGKPPTDFAAEFLAGAQRLVMKSGEVKYFLPRRWRLGGAPGTGTESLVCRVVARNFLGSEFGYAGLITQADVPVRFYSKDRLELDREVNLNYDLSS